MVQTLGGALSLDLSPHGVNGVEPCFTFQGVEELEGLPTRRQLGDREEVLHSLAVLATLSEGHSFAIEGLFVSGQAHKGLAG